MDKLKKANHLIEELASTNPHITPITPEDVSLFDTFFGAEKQHTYGNSWTYVTQGMYGIGPHNLGYKYFDGKNLSALCIYPKIEQPDINVLFWVRPMGPDILDIISTISHQQLAVENIPTYVKKIFPEQFEYLTTKGFKDVIGFPWHSLIPQEDDTFPERIIDVDQIANFGNALNKSGQIDRINRYFNSLSKITRIEISSIDTKNHKKLINQFFLERNKFRSNINISQESDYWNLMRFSNKNILSASFFDKNNVLKSFIQSEIQKNGYSSSYANITPPSNPSGYSDFVIISLIKILRDQHIKYLNLGGSEFKSLDIYKMKFKPIFENKMYWSSLY